MVHLLCDGIPFTQPDRPPPSSAGTIFLPERTIDTRSAFPRRLNKHGRGHGKTRSEASTARGQEIMAAQHVRRQKIFPAVLNLFNKDMSLLKAKWVLTILTGLFILLFEFLRHKFMRDIYMNWGNLLVAVFSSLLFLAYFTVIFRLIEKLTTRLNEEVAHSMLHEERERIAHSLHDNIAQTIFFMNIKLLEIEKSLDKKSDEFS
jgi:signal transduction histidine kinase